MSRRAPGAVRDWLLAPAPMQPLVLARIAFGLVVFWCHAARLPELQTLYGPRGLVGPRWFPHLRPYAGHFGWDVRLSHWLEAVLPPLTPEIVALLYALLLVSSLCFALGFRTRLSGLLCLALFAYFVRGRLPFAYWGWASHVQPLMLYAIAAPTGRHLSVDDWLRRRRSGAPPAPLSAWRAPAWPLRLLQVHTCTMYAVTGLARLDDLGWLRGHAVFNALINAQFSKLAIDWQPWKPVLAFFSYATFALEPLAPAMLWLRRVGPLWAYLLIALHVGLELFTNVGWWNAVMIASLASFLPTAHLDALLLRLPRGWVRQTADGESR